VAPLKSWEKFLCELTFHFKEELFVVARQIVFLLSSLSLPDNLFKFIVVARQ
jgi:hypothetical protein